MLDLQDAITLLAAVCRQWLDDAREDPAELVAVAAWLDLRPDELHVWMRPAARRPAALGERACPGCGAWLPKHNEGENGKGRKKLWCSNSCRMRSVNARKREREPCC